MSDDKYYPGYIFRDGDDYPEIAAWCNAAHYLKEGSSDLAHQLYDKVMSATRHDARMHLLMPLVYLYTSMGGRGAATLIDRFL